MYPIVPGLSIGGSVTGLFLATVVRDRTKGGGCGAEDGFGDTCCDDRLLTNGGGGGRDDVTSDVSNSDGSRCSVNGSRGSGKSTSSGSIIDGSRG